METENTTPERKTSLWKWLGLIVLIILLVAAAFVGGQLLNQQANPQAGGPGGPNSPGLFVSGGGGGPAEGTTVEHKVTPAAELPTRQPDAGGLFVRREDNSLFIGTGQITMGIGPDSNSSPSSSYDGPVVEVVVNGETVVYKEVTAFPGPPSAGEVQDEIQQEVAEGTIEEIGDTSSVIVWGRKVGDRIIADILLYSEPVIFMSPGP